MASSTRIPKSELTGIHGAMIKRMCRKMLGDVPEPVEVTWHNAVRNPQKLGWLDKMADLRR
jgi:hypothetical protein